MKKPIRFIVMVVAVSLSATLLLMVGCKKREAPSCPYSASASRSANTIRLTWNNVENAGFYVITDGYGSFLDETYGTSYTDYYPSEGYNYYRVYSENQYGRSSSYASASCYYQGEGGGSGGGSGTAPSAPTGVSAEVSGSRIHVTWNSVAGVSYYRVYKFTGADGYTILSETYGCYYYDESPITNNYYKIQAVNDYGESGLSESAFCKYSSGGGGGGGGSTTVPDAPTGVEAHDNSVVGETWVLISWNSVSNATSYKVYRSSSANGSYSLITTTEYTDYNDRNPMNGSNYYKVKAVNSAGESSYSSYAYFNNTPTVYSPCPVHYTSHTATSSKITLRWTNPTSSGCGKPTTAYLKVKDPDTDEYVVIETMPGTDTWASFSYTPWIDVFQGQRWVYCGIITENSAGISGGLALAYNVDTNTWYGGNGLKLTEEMEKELEKIEY